MTKYKCPFTDTQINWLLKNYTEGMRKTANYLGLSESKAKSRVRSLRDWLKRNNDSRWKLLMTHPGKRKPKEDEIKDYGVVHVPDIYADDDPRPIWLCIDSPRYKKQISAIYREGGNTI